MLSAAVLKMNKQYNRPPNAHPISDLSPSTNNLSYAEFSKLKSRTQNQPTGAAYKYPTKILAKTSKLSSHIHILPFSSG